MVARVPEIFSPSRRERLRTRAARRGRDAAGFLAEDVAEDVAERVAFLRHQPRHALVSGDHTGAVARALPGIALTDGSEWDDESPYPEAGFDLAVSLFRLDSANDLPGALIHLHSALAPGGLAIAALVGAGSLPVLRAMMLAADADRPAARMHPLVDVRGGGPLLQRAGWTDPVIDTRTLSVSYASPERLIADLRDQGLTSRLASPAPPIGKAGWERARAAFRDLADDDGRVTETFEILTLSGWKR
ncbi:methyltransferase [Parablastomonas sp. CN1-191]|uniref:methyltransferase n=1 Tax=Parablastomonas sp. CN1-191 TaxID=3400908 RepID=UPI003BF8ED23